MGGMLIAGLAVPEAFSHRAVMFASAYTVVRIMQFVLFVIAGRGTVRSRKSGSKNSSGGCDWFSVIVVGAVSKIDPLEIWWTTALVLEFGTLLIVNLEGWRVSAGHFSERHGLIFIIPLGEAVISIGIGAAGLVLDEQVIIPSLLGLLVIVTMWWTYFDVIALAGERRLHSLSGIERVSLAQHAYTYCHLPMVGGAILFSLAVKKTLAHAYEPLSLIPTVALAGGPQCFCSPRSIHRQDGRSSVCATTGDCRFVFTRLTDFQHLCSDTTYGGQRFDYDPRCFRSDFRDRIRTSSHETWNLK